MYRKEEEKIKSGFDNVAPDLFGEIKKREYKKIESEEELFGTVNNQKVQKKQKAVVVPFRPRVVLGSIAAVILCCLICTQLFASKAQATKIMIDVNSGMQFMVTENNHKIKVVPLGAGSQNIAKAISEEDTLEEVIYELLENLNKSEYFQESDAGMLVSYVNQKKDDSYKKVSSMIREYFQEEKLQASLVQQEVEEKSKLQKEADEQGISLGKYCFLKALQEEYQMDPQAMYQKGMGDIFQEVCQQGIDLSKDARIEYIPAEAELVLADKESEMTSSDEDTSLPSKDKKGKKDSKEVLDNNTKKESTGEKKAQTKKKEEMPANQKPESNEKDKKLQEKISVPSATIPSAAPESSLPAEESQMTADTEGIVAAATEPAAPPAGEDKTDDKTKQEKIPEDKKDTVGSPQDKGKEHDWSGSGKDQTLDCDMDDIKEQIKEYMKNHPHSKKGYEELYQEWYLEGDETVQKESSERTSERK